MAINYKKELENAAKTMILVHEPHTLIHMIVRMIVQKVKVDHAGILLHDKEKNTYVLTVSRGTSGIKIPRGFARMDPDNPLVRFFKKNNESKLFKGSAFVYGNTERILKKKTLKPGIKQLLKNALYQMEIFDAQVCIPSYFRDELLGILLLGSKTNGKEIDSEDLGFFTALTSDVAMAIRNAQLFRELELELDKKQRLFINTTVALAAVIDAKDHYTHGHTSRVTDISLGIANRLVLQYKAKINPKIIEQLQIASLLHDIGKIGIPEAILNKQGPLNEEERKRMQQHPLVGLTILQHIKELDECLLGVRHHHERFDGTGYPDRLKGNQIPLIASIIAVADAYDAMTSDRPYRQALSKEKAIEEIKRSSGKQFDPLVAESLISLYQENKI